LILLDLGWDRFVEQSSSSGLWLIAVTSVKGGS